MVTSPSYFAVGSFMHWSRPSCDVHLVAKKRKINKRKITGYIFLVCNPQNKRSPRRYLTQQFVGLLLPRIHGQEGFVPHPWSNSSWQKVWHVLSSHLEPFLWRKKWEKKNQTRRFMRTTIFTLPYLVAEKQRKQNQTSFLFLEPQNLRPYSCIQTFGSPDSLHLLTNQTRP